MTVELADIHVEDVKAGYILHHPQLGPIEIDEDAYEYRDVEHGGPMVDLSLAGYQGAEWLTYERCEIVQVEA